MATTVDMKGQQVVWGTTELGTPVANGICVSGELSEAAATDRVENENGQRTGIIFYDTDWAGTLEVVCKASCTAPSIGAAVTVDSKTLYVTNCRRRWGNKEKKQLSITLEGGANIAASSGGGGSSGGST